MPELFAVCAVARNETPYLVEWVAYQRLMGASTILIYDNGHDDRGSALLKNLDRSGIITRAEWYGPFSKGPQLPAYEDALARLRGKIEWALFTDLDEFVVPTQADNLLEIFSSAQKADAIWFPWLIFGSGGQEEYRHGPMMERFTRRQSVDYETVTPVKSAVRPNQTIRAGIHVHDIATDAYENPLGERDFITNRINERRASQPARGYDVARVHHYMTKSRQEWGNKVARGKADRGPEDPDRKRDMNEFTLWDRNEVFDDSALRFLPRLREEMRLLHEITSTALAPGV